MLMRDFPRKQGHYDYELSAPSSTGLLTNPIHVPCAFPHPCLINFADVSVFLGVDKSSALLDAWFNIHAALQSSIILQCTLCELGILVQVFRQISDGCKICFVVVMGISRRKMDRFVAKNQEFIPGCHARPATQGSCQT